MANKFLGQLMAKFKALPPVGKVAVAGGTGLGIYWLVRAFQGGETLSVEGENDGVIYYPYATGSQDLGFTDASGSGMDGWYLNGGETGGSGVSSDEFQQGLADIKDYVDRSVFDTIGQLEASKYYPDDTVIDTNQVDPNKGYKVVSGTEGTNRYSTKYFADGTVEIYKNGALVPEENYQYIPQEYGGTRTTGSGLTQKANQALYEAQAAYQKAYNAGDKKAMAQAEAAGQAARKQGATEAGADAIWKANFSGSSGSSKKAGSASSSSKNTSSSSSKSTASGSNANKALYNAQKDYMNAYNKGDKAGMAAAEKAGQAARAQGATDSGADAIWKGK